MYKDEAKREYQREYMKKKRAKSVRPMLDPETKPAVRPSKDVRPKVLDPVRPATEPLMPNGETVKQYRDRLWKQQEARDRALSMFRHQGVNPYVYEPSLASIS